MTLQLFNTWEFNIVAYLICNVAFNQFYRLAAKTAKNDGATTTLLQIMAGLFILILSPLFPMVFTDSIYVYLVLFIACVFYAINDRINTTTRKHLDVGETSIISQTTNIFLTLSGLLIFHDPFIRNKIIAVVLIIIGNIILLYKGRKFAVNRYVVYQFISTISMAIALSIDIGISKQFNLPFYIMMTLICPAIMIAITERISPRAILEQITPENWKYFGLVSVSWGLLILFILRSYQLGTVTTIVPFSASSVLLSVIAAYVFLNEREHVGRKCIAAAFVVLGIVLNVM